MNPQTTTRSVQLWWQTFNVGHNCCEFLKFSSPGAVSRVNKWNSWIQCKITKTLEFPHITSSWILARDGTLGLCVENEPENLNCVFCQGVTIVANNLLLVGQTWFALRMMRCAQRWMPGSGEGAATQTNVDGSDNSQAHLIFHPFHVVSPHKIMILRNLQIMNQNIPSTFCHRFGPIAAASHDFQCGWRCTVSQFGGFSAPQIKWA